MNLPDKVYKLLNFYINLGNFAFLLLMHFTKTNALISTHVNEFSKSVGIPWLATFWIFDAKKYEGMNEWRCLIQKHFTIRRNHKSCLSRFSTLSLAGLLLHKYWKSQKRPRVENSPQVLSSGQFVCLSIVELKSLMCNKSS